MTKIFIFIISFLFLNLFGISEVSAKITAPSKTSNAEESTGTTKIKICGKKLTVDIMDNDETRAKGLMFRKSMPDTYGMLFVYDKEQKLSFWMKNTYIPLSIGYFDRDKKLIDIQDMKPLDTSILYPSKKPAQFAIEVNKGWYAKNKVDVGCKYEYDF